jgi:hypothetical protein
VLPLVPEEDVPLPLDEDDELVPEEDGMVVLLLLPVAGALLVAAGGVVAGVVAGWADGCLAQAVSSKAAASALRATLVFIDSTPVE